MSTRELLVALGPDASSVVFVGGTVRALYPNATDLRPTNDVDITAPVTTAGYELLMALEGIA